MPDIRRSLPLATPDFDDNRASIKTFLSSQDELKDFNFDGSAMSVLIDALAFNAHIDAFYLNQIGNEAFLKTAIRRDSVVARAKSQGYTPRSARAASIGFDMIMTSSLTSAFITVPSGFTITVSDNGTTYQFRTISDYQAIRQSNGTYLAEGLVAYQGTQLSYQYTVEAADLNNGRLLPNANVDTSLIRVYVAPAANTTAFEEFFPTEDITLVGPTEKVYYIDEEDGGLHEVYFGDNVISAAVSIGDVVKIDYFVTDGDVANGLSSFGVASAISGITGFTLIPDGRSTGGAAQESISSIKFNAPKANEIQNRAVTASDYPPLIRKIFPAAADSIAWGGEDNVPPMPGKAIIAVKPRTGAFLTDKKKTELETLLRKYNMLRTTPVIIDPEYVYVNVVSNVTFTGTRTALSKGQMEDLISAKIDQFSDEYLETFGSEFYYGQLVTYINSIEQSIISNNTDIFVEVRNFPLIGIAEDYKAEFITAIKPGTFVTSAFTTNGKENCVIMDCAGSVDLVQIIGQTKKTIQSGIGTINYTTGLVTVSGLVVDSVNETDTYFDQEVGDYFIKFAAETENEDINLNGGKVIAINLKIINATKLSGSR